MAEQENLGDAVRRFGFAKQTRIKLYGKQLEIISDPVNRDGDDVFVQARDEGTNDVREMQVPRNVVKMAKAGR